MIDGKVPVRPDGRASFFDVDGTLLEIAETPGAVHVPERLKDLLRDTALRESGALALISGRSLAELDRLFAPYRFAAAGSHGLERRDAAGRYTVAVNPELTRNPEFTDVRIHLQRFCAEHPGLLFEDKGLSLALHYRRVPHLETRVFEIMGALVAQLGPPFHLQRGKCVCELKPAAANKRSAIEAFMKETPFAGRTPIFIGDDITDEDGFAAVNAAGGDSIRVGLEGTSVARWRFASVQEVINWLEGSARSAAATENAR